MENIFIVTNFWIFLEELQASNFEKPKYISFCSDYCKTLSKNDLEDLKKSINEIIGKYTLLEEDDVFSKKFDKVYMSSGTPLYGDFKYSKRLNCKEYIFVEDGGYDYSNEDIKTLKEERKISSIYVFDKDNFTMSNYYKNVKTLSIEKNIKIIKEKIEDDIFKIDKNTPILFTGPTEVQNNKKIEKILNSYKEIIIKQHPRDSRNFKKYNNVIICKKSIPGQILDVLFVGEKLFEYENPTILIEKEQLANIK